MKVTKFVQKQKKKIVTAIAAANVAAMSVNNVFAAPPAGVDPTQYNTLVNLVFWVAVIAIAAAGGIPSLIKLVQGQADEDPRGRNAGIAGLVITGAVIGAASAVKNLLF